MYKHHLLIVIIFSILLSVSCSSSSGAEDTAEFSKPAVAPADAIVKAEKLYKERKNLENVRRALKILDQARNMDNRNFDIEWKFAQYSYFLGNDYRTSDEEAEEILKRGLIAAKIAKRMKPDRPQGHFWYGAVLGEQSKRNPVTIGITSIDDIRKSLQKVIEIEPTYYGASAFDGLGLLELKTVGLVGGDEKKAIELFEKGVELEKNNSFLRLHLAEAYLAMKPDEDFLPEYERSVQEANKLLKEKF